MSFNLRWLNDEYDFGVRHWNIRKTAVMDVIRKYSPDILCLQEAVIQQVEYIAAGLQDYDYYAVYRDGNDLGESCAIFYQKQKFLLMRKHTFWLSTTPNIPSLSWGAMYERMCSVILLKLTDSDNKVWIANTHFDHKSKLALQNSANLIIKELSAFSPNESLVLMGDFNLARKSSPYYRFIAAGFADLSQDPKILSSTNPKWVTSHGFRGTQQIRFFSSNQYCIDWILYQKLIPLSYSVCFDRPNKIYPSDHWPIIGEFRFPLP